MKAKCFRMKLSRNVQNLNEKNYKAPLNHTKMDWNKWEDIPLHKDNGFL